jgi:hypothetical protein
MRWGEGRCVRAAIPGAVLLGTLLGALLWSTEARAQDARLQGVFTGSLGVTDNVYSSAEPDEEADPDADGPEADAFGSVSPGLLFRYDTPRTSQTLSYTFTANFFFSQFDASSYTNSAAWAGRFITSPTTALSLGATGTHGQLNTLVRNQEPGQTQLDPVPGGTSTVFLQGGLSQGFSKQLSPVLTMAEGASFTAYEPLQENPPRTTNVAGTLSAQRLWRHDTGTLALSAAYTHFENVNAGTDEAPLYVARDQLLASLVASWQHDYGRHFSSQLDVGVSQATDVSGGYAQLWQPVGLAAVRYAREEGQAELAYAHAAQLNVFLQQLALVDQVTLRAALPVNAAARLGSEGSVGVQRSQPIEEGVLGAPSTVFLADAALLWSPVTRIPDFELSLRYQHVNQLAPGAGGATDQIVTNTLIASVSGAFPRTTVTENRIVMTQPFGTARQAPQRRSGPTPEAEEAEQAEQPSGGAAP